MSDQINYDSCGKIAKRRLGKISPADWYYLEAKDDSSNEIIIVYACSKECAWSQWQLGPGKLDLTKKV